MNITSRTITCILPRHHQVQKNASTGIQLPLQLENRFSFICSRGFQSKDWGIKMTSRKCTFSSHIILAQHMICMGCPRNSLSVFWWHESSNLIGWHQIWVDYGPVGGLGRVPRPPSGPGSYPLALGHQLGMTFTKAPPKFSTYVIILNIRTLGPLTFFLPTDWLKISRIKEKKSVCGFFFFGQTDRPTAQNYPPC